MRYLFFTAAFLVLTGCSSDTVSPDFVAKLIRTGNRQDCLEVLKQPFDPNTPTKDNDFILNIAIQHGDPVLVEAVLKKGAKVDAAKGKTQTTPLDLAARQGNVAIVRALLSHRADPKQRDAAGNLPVAYSANPGIAEALIVSTVELVQPNRSGGSVLDEAIKGRRKEVVKVLLDAGAANAIRNKGGAQLELAAENDDVPTIDLLVQNGADINQPVREKDTITFPITAAAASHAYRAAVSLVKHGARINVSGAHGWTPLHEAAAAGDVQMATFLLQNGAKVDAKDAIGRAPLHLAVFADAEAGLLANSPGAGQPSQGSLPMVRLLVQNKASVDLADSHGWTPLFRAVTMDDRPVIAELIQAGANPKRRDADGRAISEILGGLKRSEALAMLHRGGSTR